VCHDHDNLTMSKWGNRLAAEGGKRKDGTYLDPLEKKRKKILEQEKAKIKQQKIDDERGTVLVSTLKMRKK